MSCRYLSKLCCYHVFVKKCRHVSFVIDSKCCLRVQIYSGAIVCVDSASYIMTRVLYGDSERYIMTRVLMETRKGIYSKNFFVLDMRGEMGEVEGGIPIPPNYARQTDYIIYSTQISSVHERGICVLLQCLKDYTVHKHQKRLLHFALPL